jgi:isopentenyl-diphosphate Delta-isomerase
MFAPEHVVLVDRNDVAIGTAEKLGAHTDALLHRAISIFVFDDGGRVLLQRRAEGKYHSAGLWSNTCCSHPRPGESTIAAADRRLREEMGMSCALYGAFSFVYRADVGNGLVEHEYDHVFIGRSNATPCPDPFEVSEWRRIAPRDLALELSAHPERFTPWLAVAWQQLLMRGLVPAGRSRRLVPG